MQAFKTQRGRIAGLDRANIDTDAIIPKQFLKSIRRTGFGENLFFDWKFLPDGTLNPDFELNQPRFQGAKFLVARNNFGCGSSREHAVWAVAQAGFTAVFAPVKEGTGGTVPGFADIFRNNALKNGILAAELTDAQVDRIFALIAAHPGLEATVSLETQTLTLHAPSPESFRFEIPAAARDYLMAGLDDIGLSLKHEARIGEFEHRHNAQMMRRPA